MIIYPPFFPSLLCFRRGMFLSWLARLHNGPIDCGPRECPALQVLGMQQKWLHRRTACRARSLFAKQTQRGKSVQASIVLYIPTPFSSSSSSPTFNLWQSVIKIKEFLKVNSVCSAKCEILRFANNELWVVEMPKTIVAVPANWKKRLLHYLWSNSVPFGVVYFFSHCCCRCFATSHAGIHSLSFCNYIVYKYVCIYAGIW